MAQEGQGRQDRKLAVARHRRRRGRSEFIVAQNQDGIFCTADNNFLGTVGANLVGSKYQIWGQVHPHLKSRFFLVAIEHLLNKCS
jgi:tubby-related protein 1